MAASVLWLLDHAMTQRVAVAGLAIGSPLVIWWIVRHPWKAVYAGYFVLDEHLNARGHEIVAEAVARRIRAIEAGGNR